MNKNLERQNQTLGCVILVLIIAIVWLVIKVSFDKPSGSRVASPTKAPRISEIDAFVWCQGYVKDRLKSPASAKFPFGEFSYRDLGSNTWRIVSYVDSQNSFGAMVRTNWACEIQYRNGNWFLQDITLTQK